mgnify:CR=1 FL=1
MWYGALSRRTTLFFLQLGSVESSNLTRQWKKSDMIPALVFDCNRLRYT